ncbi:mercuric reductase [Ktedonobacter racemifer]|uniref:FAD-dependent pyridine nucleotide-disulfide oxidoreductase n=1 Tax=Ktedonobacter racemifer DSM 44963 TaxID=485913 RepID=D6TBP4_KTERA|nr:mercuric reductase [Ktedonobacter racemifer]EFH89826.1 FAD-dependent pyridine nucleotide-disulfide oxidoreductase [Ktedonobacter racemifer DSM 44963]
MTSTHYDVIVIGTSQGGRFLPIEFARAGRKVALIERDHMGGVCVNVGCTPTKTMVASARLAYQARRGAEYGVHTGPISVDLQAVRQRKQGMVEGARLNYESRLTELQGLGLDLLLGEAHFLAPKTLEVSLQDGGTREITAPLIVIDTGARPEPLTIKGAERVPVLNSTTIIELDTLPEHLFILGGGYIGLEFGQMFRRFGSQVTIIQSRPRLLMNEDEDVSKEVAKILREEGITVLTGAMPQQVESLGEGRMQLTVHTPQGEQQLIGSHLLAATGRVPNTEALTPEAAGIHLDQAGYIQVNERLETNVSGIYALGDVKGGPAFTHVSYDDYRILRTNLLEHGSASTRDRLVPHTIFIDPQLGRVGLTENEARKQGRTIRVAKLPMNAVPRALETGEMRGFMKAIVDAETQHILGCAILGVEGGEIMTIIQVAMMGNLPYTALRDGIFTHPTLAEGLNSLFMTLDS